MAPIRTLRLKPGDPDLLVAATYGRGVYGTVDVPRPWWKPRTIGFSAGDEPVEVCIHHPLDLSRALPVESGARILRYAQIMEER